MRIQKLTIREPSRTMEATMDFLKIKGVHVFEERFTYIRFLGSRVRQSSYPISYVIGLLLLRVANTIKSG